MNSLRPLLAFTPYVATVFIANACSMHAFAEEEIPLGPSVGVSASISDLVLPGTELKTVPIDDNSPIVLRIDNARVHGDSYRYDLVYYGLEPGTYDLRDWLMRGDGSSKDDLPNIPITISSVLPEGQIVPNDLENQDTPSVGGYRAMMWTLGVAWVVGLLALIFWPKTKRESANAAEAAPVTLADRLRHYIEAAIAGDLPDSSRGEMERLLLGYWHAKLGVGDLPPAQAIAKLRDHETAGQLLKALERWLHSPDAEPPSKEEIVNLLEPYSKTSEL
ncbi:MAG: hypothetical protein KDB27_06560 [Planctomycetales bacterium]|nr:hypothetical protein [Planctomycetales bacterium]